MDFNEADKKTPNILHFLFELTSLHGLQANTLTTTREAFSQFVINKFPITTEKHCIKCYNYVIKYP